MIQKIRSFPQWFFKWQIISCTVFLWDPLSFSEQMFEHLKKCELNWCWFLFRSGQRIRVPGLCQTPPKSQRKRHHLAVPLRRGRWNWHGAGWVLNGRAKKKKIQWFDHHVSSYYLSIWKSPVYVFECQILGRIAMIAHVRLEEKNAKHLDCQDNLASLGIDYDFYPGSSPVQWHDGDSERWEIAALMGLSAT